jgi:hypothetical protein
MLRIYLLMIFLYEKKAVVEIFFLIIVVQINIINHKYRKEKKITFIQVISRYQVKLSLLQINSILTSFNNNSLEEMLEESDLLMAVCKP